MRQAPSEPARPPLPHQRDRPSAGPSGDRSPAWLVPWTNGRSGEPLVSELAGPDQERIQSCRVELFVADQRTEEDDLRFVPDLYRYVFDLLVGIHGEDKSFRDPRVDLVSSVVRSGSHVTGEFDDVRGTSVRGEPLLDCLAECSRHQRAVASPGSHRVDLVKQPQVLLQVARELCPKSRHLLIANRHHDPLLRSASRCMILLPASITTTPKITAVSATDPADIVVCCGTSGATYGPAGTRISGWPTGAGRSSTSCVV